MPEFDLFLYSLGYEKTESLGLHLISEQFRVQFLSDGDIAFQKLANETAVKGLLIATAEIFDADKLDFIAKLRIINPQIPLIIFAEYCTYDLKVQALHLGADDVIVQPAGLMELSARINALSRRLPTKSDMIIQIGNLTLNPGSRMVISAGKPVHLTRMEFELLQLLIRRKGKPVSRSEILSKVWGFNAQVSSRTIDTHIAEIRNKIEPNRKKPAYILTVPKVGYRFSEPEKIIKRDESRNIKARISTF